MIDARQKNSLAMRAGPRSKERLLRLIGTWMLLRQRRNSSLVIVNKAVVGWVFFVALAYCVVISLDDLGIAWALVCINGEQQQKGL